MAAELDESTRRVIEAFDRLSGRLSTEEEKREEAARKAYEKMMGLVIQAINELAIQVDKIKGE